MYLDGANPLAAVNATARTIHTALANPIADQANEALQSSAHVLDTVPNSLMEEMMSDAWDFVTPVRKFVKSPSQLSRAGTALAAV